MLSERDKLNNDIQAISIRRPKRGA